MLLKSTTSRLRTISIVQHLRFSSAIPSSTATKDDERNILRIGSVSTVVHSPKDPAFVPRLYYDKISFPKSYIKHLEWLMKKDLLNQDSLLIGAPGPLRRQLVMAYLELNNKQFEYIQLNRDITDSDIKQRREILDKSALYIDQAAVKAAVTGHVLILDGIEKAERNVLPILNNLLENREMNLDDGRFLVSTQRYDSLLKTYTKEQLNQLNFVRVNEQFRIIALTLPIPAYKGNSLDPPLRSRFQLRDIGTLSYDEHIQLLKLKYPQINDSVLQNLLSFSTLINSTELDTLKLIHFPTERIDLMLNLYNVSSSTLTLPDLIHRIYPYNVLYQHSTETKQGINDIYKKLSINSNIIHNRRVKSIKIENSVAQVNLEIDGKEHQIKVSAGTSVTSSLPNFIMTPYHENLLVDLILSHAVGDICLVGSKGCGKSLLTENFASLLNYSIEHFVLYKDLSARELLQQRVTNEHGDTQWINTPIVDAALNGKILVLDGIHRLYSDTLISLQRLVQDRELTLPDGTTLLRHDRYDYIQNEVLNCTTETLLAKKIYRIHPSFRIIALAEPPGGDSTTASTTSGSSPNSVNEQNWLHAETLTLFQYHHMRPLNYEEERRIVYSACHIDKDNTTIDRVLRFVNDLRNSNDNQLKMVSRSLSTRNVIRIAKHLKYYTSESDHLYELMMKSTCAQFLPRLVYEAFIDTLNKAGIKESVSELSSSSLNLSPSNHDTEKLLFDHAAKVPFTTYYENPLHNDIIRKMHESFTLGEHLLLIGPQGVAKNRLTDHYLQTRKLPREYIQLHRDTTVQSLTIQANVIDGRIVYEDSPLIKAIKYGSVAVIDEADKAPSHVTSILKSLIENGYMYLSDNRRIFPPKQEHQNEADIDPNIIHIHPNFRMIVLANRPGFPFLGNDFFVNLGDLFATFPILNPPRESEIILLEKFAPDIKQQRSTIELLVDVFTDLRQLYNEGTINYPFSLRELVSMVKHMNKYPEDNLPDILRNVFDYDNYNVDLHDRIRTILHRHGIPFNIDNRHVKLSNTYPINLKFSNEKWLTIKQEKGRLLQEHPIRTSNILKQKQPILIDSLNRINSRTQTFSELTFNYRLPMDETAFVHDFNILSNDTALVLTANPLCLWTFKMNENQAKKFEINNLLQPQNNARYYTPQYQLYVIPDQTNTVVIGESISQNFAFFNIMDGTGSLIENGPSSIVQKVSKLLQPSSLLSNSSYNPTNGQLIVYGVNNDIIHLYDFCKNMFKQIKLPFIFRSIVPFQDTWIFNDKDQQSFMIHIDNKNEDIPVWLIQQNIHNIGFGYSGKEWFTSSEDYFARVVNNDNSLDIDRLKRPKRLLMDVSPSETYEKRRLQTFYNQKHSIIASLYAKDLVEKKFRSKEESDILSYLEVLNLSNNYITYIPLLKQQRSSTQHDWFMHTKSSSGVLAAQAKDGTLLTIDSKANISTFEIVPSALEISLDNWNKQVKTNEENLSIEYLKGGKTDLSGPKHGKVDPNNQPHVGGNRWAGGSGGRDTAGLGGIGGPYRLDSGHQVYQVPDEVKNNVPDHIREAARELGQKVFKQRLKEIEMSEYDNDVYQKYSSKIQSEIKLLRSIIENLESKSKDRQWIRHRTSGDFDERKLIEGVIGETSVYKHRADIPPEPGTPQTKAKRLRLIVDLSASMYRFNGVDGRLERQCECVLMFLESLSGYEHKFVYDIIGHSGDSPDIEIVSKHRIPKNNKERLKIIKTMYTHTMFCNSGDYTLTSTKQSIAQLAKEADENLDERFLIVISDANFDRYGISPKEFGQLLNSNEMVQCFAIFIGSLGQQAAQLQKNLPSGKGFVCLETKNIPKVLKTIFTSDVLH